MALTDEEKQEIIAALLEEIKAASSGIEDLNVVDTLTGINSLPATYGEELVNVPLTLLQQPATDAADAANEAATAANNAATAANEAASKATTAAESAEAASQLPGSGQVVGSVNITELDSLYVTDDNRKGEMPVLLQVKYGTLNVGILRVFSDGSGHCITQVLTTHNILNEDGTLAESSHSDTEVYVYYRSYSFTSPNITTGTWSSWQDITLTLRSQLVTYIDDSDKTLQTNIEAEASERESADKELMERATVSFDGIVAIASVRAVSATEITGVVFVKLSNVFAGVFSGGYCSNWAATDSYPSADMYMNSTRDEILKDKIYTCDGIPYAWSESENTLVQVGRRMEILSEEEYEQLSTKGDSTIYFTYEEDDA
ncbi:MAG: hypothetical protein Q4D41_00255 [Prevotellaceae bacterium]|nr:hypothetical protein [Prevotellaceae bacterium]